MALANHWPSTHKIHIITLVKNLPFYPLNITIRLAHCLEEPQTETNVLKSAFNAGRLVKRLSQHLKIQEPPCGHQFYAYDQHPCS